MTTYRFYPRAVAPDVTVGATGAQWEASTPTGAAGRWESSKALSSISFAIPTAPTGTTLARVLVGDSGALPVGSLGGATIRFATPIRNNSTGAARGARLVVRVVSADGTTSRGIAAILTTPSSPGGSSHYVRCSSAIAADVDVQAGDRLVGEWGFSAGGSGPSCSIGSSTAQPDVPFENSASAVALNQYGWLEVTPLAPLEPVTRLYFTEVTPSLALPVAPQWTSLDVDGNSGPRVLATIPSTYCPAIFGGYATSGDLARQAGVQGISEPMLPTGTIAGRLRFAAAVAYINGGRPTTFYLAARVLSADGATVRGTLYAGTIGAAWVNVNNRTYAGEVDVTPVAAQAGDRLVVEVGVEMPAGGSFVGGGNVVRGADNATDVPYVDGATASDKRPWVELRLAIPPAAPLDLTATPSASTVALSWTAPTTGGVPTGYTVSVNGGAPVEVGNVTAHTLTGLTPGTTYAVEVRTLAGTMTSPPASVTTTTLAPPPRDRRFWTNRLLDLLGIYGDAQPVVQVRRWSAGAWVLDADLSHALSGYSVTYGRSTPTGTTDPVKATLTLATRQAGAVQPEAGTRLQVALCEPVRLALGLTAAQAVRFTGEVTDPSVSHASRLTTLVCIGRLGRANRAPVDGAAWPVEDDGARVPRILEATGLGLTTGAIDEGDALLAAPTRLEPAAKLLDIVVNSTGGQVVEQPDGAVDWHDANHRRGVNPTLTLSADEVFRAITWAQRVGEVVNDATVKTASGDTVRVLDPSSADPVDGYGPYPASVDTALVDEEDAYALGTLLVGRRARPAWALPDVVVDLLRTLPVDDLGPALTLRHGNRLTIAGLPEGCPVPARVFVEGWTEAATATSWRLTIAVSDPALSGISPRYMDVPPTDAYQYLDVSPTMRYIDVARTEDPAELL